jgi:hypothetical protein
VLFEKIKNKKVKYFFYQKPLVGIQHCTVTQQLDNLSPTDWAAVLLLKPPSDALFVKAVHGYLAAIQDKNSVSPLDGLKAHGAVI